MKASGMIVNLTAPLDVLRKRVGKGRSRPNWNEKVESLFHSRQAAYSDADLIIRTDELSAKKSAEKIITEMGTIPEPVPVLLENQPYPVYTGRGIFGRFEILMKRHVVPEGLFVMADENVLGLYKSRIESALGNIRHVVMEVPFGEGSKSFVFLEKVMGKMLEAQMNRQWACLAIGGGITGDLAGFAASMFMRGIPVIQVPTTLLAQVDASIGGKTGINHELGKNLIGAFWQPSFVLCDDEFLGTLDDGNMKGGMSEVVKYGIIMNRGLFEHLENGSPDMEKVVRMCCRDKAHVVARDEREGSLRRILNFGHTLGHAVEQYYDFRIHHGEAVAMGMDFACFLSHEMGLLNGDDLARTQSLMNKFGLVSGKYKMPPTGRVRDAMSVDKKSAGSGIHFVLAKGIGDFEVRKLELDFIVQSYERYLSGH
jgi:3-dehydroquinate synthase